MGMKFDGTVLKSGGTTIANVKNGVLREGQYTGKVLIKLADAAKKIGTSSQGPTTALVWYFFAK